jgi:hypothetical protein
MMLHRLKGGVRIQLHSHDSDENFVQITGHGVAVQFPHGVFLCRMERRSKTPVSVTVMPGYPNCQNIKWSDHCAGLNHSGTTPLAPAPIICQTQKLLVDCPQMDK